MHLLYFTLGIGPGDEVIVPAQTHVATAHAVELTGAKAVFVDVCLETGNISPKLVEKAITKNTRAIAVVHYLGVMADMPELNKIAKANGLFLLEDCALAHGAEMNGIHAGLHGDAGVFSFYPVKHMTTGEGGTIILNNTELASKLKLTKAFGIDRSHSERKTPGIYDSLTLGFNYRMSEVHAAIGIPQVDKLPAFIDIRRKNFRRLEAGIKKITGIEILPQPENNNNKCSFYCLGLLLDSNNQNKRKDVMSMLSDVGIGTSIYYPSPVPRLSYYKTKYGYDSAKFRNAEIISDNIIALPVGPHLNEQDIDYIIENIVKIWSFEVSEFSNLKEKKILITGGAGFIGHNLALQIQRLGGDVTVVDSLQVNNLGFYTTNYVENLNAKRYIAFLNERLNLLRNANITLKITDAREYHQISRIIDEVAPDVIVHLAAVSHANRSNKDPYSTFDHSMRTLENVLDGSKSISPTLFSFLRQWFMEILGTNLHMKIGNANRWEFMVH